jgi:hypothetical protein
MSEEALAHELGLSNTQLAILRKQSKWLMYVCVWLCFCANVTIDYKIRIRQEVRADINEADTETNGMLPK